MTRTRELLQRTADYAAEFLDSLPTRRVAPVASLEALRAALGGPLPEVGLAPERVVDALVQGVEPGLLASGGGRFFGWVIGGTLPAALAADWLTSAWDQNAAIVATSPAAAVVEEVCGVWLKEVLPIPAHASFALVTGSQMAHTTALAAARHHLLAQRGWDVERYGLSGAPPLRVLASELRHESVERSLRLLGIGTEAVTRLPAGPSGSVQVGALATALKHAGDTPTIVCLQAGELHTGAFDPFAEACKLARDQGAWTHVDGAFGLWAAASPTLRTLLEGVDEADSWVTDGHKWLNTPFDIGFVFVAHPDAHAEALRTGASYFAHDPLARDQMDWNPEWSRRARGFAVYAGLQSLGKRGLAELVDRCVHYVRRLVTEIGALDEAEVVSEPVINQGLVRFLARDGHHDARTDAVIRHLQMSGETWFGGTTWRGERAMRGSVCSWRTTEADVEHTLSAPVEHTLSAVRAALKATVR
jgi:glutamate/tyrosine decarboxylase-like PLP-dependent enzyme